MTVRKATPGALRWAGYAIMLGFYAAIGLWAFDLGKSLAGLDTQDREELRQLRDTVAQLRKEREEAQSVLNTSGSAITAEKVVQQRMTAQLRALEADNRALRDDLGFFEKLMPASGAEAISIRGLQAEVLAGSQLKWQVLVIQPLKNAPEFRGKLQLSVAGTLAGAPWIMELPGGAQPLQFRQYRRIEGMLDLPASAVVKNVSAKVVEGNSTRAAHHIKL